MELEVGAGWLPFGVWWLWGWQLSLLSFLLFWWDGASIGGSGLWLFLLGVVFVGFVGG